MSLDTLAIISQMAGAVIFVLVAFWMFNKWIQPAIVAYQAAKNAELADAETRREQMKASCAAARAEIEQAEADATEIRARVASAVGRERSHALDAAQAEAHRVVRNAEGELERARLAARDRLRIEFIDKALARARDEAARRIDAAAEERLVEATVGDVLRKPI